MAELNLLCTGETAPRFTFSEADGTVRTTDQLKGRPFVVYFYPKDDTPGCTTEACGFRDSWGEFTRLNVPVIGVSPDDDASHQKFRAKHNLPFALATDPDHAISQSFGVWGEKQYMGRRYEGVHRVTFLIDAQGRIAKVYPKVKPDQHARELLCDLSSLNSTI
jgi:thioredoxin-dependent peroxiredoxin